MQPDAPTPVLSLSKETKRERAAQLLAIDELADWQIAQALEIDRTTLTRWKQQGDFCQRVIDLQGTYAERMRRILVKYPLCRKGRRMQSKQDRYDRLTKMMNERADDPDMAGVPGGATGLMVKTVIERTMKDGSHETRTTYKLDYGLLKEFRELEKSVAHEMGQLPRVDLDDGQGDTYIQVNNTQVNVDGQPDGWRSRLTALCHQLGQNTGGSGESTATPPGSDSGPGVVPP